MAKKTTTAGAFDIRNIIGLLLTIFGVILTILGGVSYDDADAAKTGDVNINLIVGIIILVVGVCFLLWAKAHPQVVPADPDSIQEANEINDEKAVSGGDAFVSLDDKTDKKA